MQHSGGFFVTNETMNVINRWWSCNLESYLLREKKHFL